MKKNANTMHLQHYNLLIAPAIN